MELLPAEQVSFSADLSGDDICLSMGIPTHRPLKPRLQQYVAEALTELSERAQPTLVWRIGGPQTILERLAPSRQLQRFLKKAELAAVFVGSAGHEWQNFISEQSDPMKAYILSVSGTALARHTLVQIRKELALRHPELQVGAQMSPGNTGLPLKIQCGIADLLPLAEAGIGFDNESLMLTPLASVSAVVRLRRSDAPTRHFEESRVSPDCIRCNSLNCTIRVAPFEPTAALSC